MPAASFLDEPRRFDRPVGVKPAKSVVRAARTAIETACVVLGLALVVAALAAAQPWLDQHFLPSFLLPRRAYVRLETACRIAMAISGALLATVGRAWIGRFVTRAPGLALSVAVAAVLAIAAAEPVLRRVHVQYAGWLLAGEEPLRRVDPRL